MLFVALKNRKKKMRIMIYFGLLFRNMVHTMEFYFTELILGSIASNGSYFQIFMEGTVNKFQRYHVIHYWSLLSRCVL